MALIAMAVHDTPENGRDKLTRQTLDCLARTVDCALHDIYIIINAATDEAEDAIMTFQGATDCNVIRMPENVGTAKAINQAWLQRKPGQNAIKMDNDVVIHCDNWVEVLEDCIERDSEIGIIGLKRKDCMETPFRIDQMKSELMMLPHEPGAPWRIVEKVQHVIGTCQMYSAALLHKIGYLYQPNLYGFDDSLAAVRCQVAGFYSCFYPHIEIDHIDPGGTPYQAWKEREAGKDMQEYNKLKGQFQAGSRPVWIDADY